MTASEEDYENAEAQVFLPSQQKESRATSVKTTKRWKPAISKWPVLHLIALSVYSSLSALVVVHLRKESVPHTLLPLAAQEAIEWETRKLTAKMRDNPFTGDSRPELDKAWHDLLQNTNIRIPTAELHRLNLTSINILNSDESLAGLSVYHALHCLKKIRQFTNFEHYYPGASTTKKDFERRHTDHCIEYIRQSLMCKPDLSWVTYEWTEGAKAMFSHTGNGESDVPQGDRLVPANGDKGVHECVNWEGLERWVGERRFDLYRVDLLRVPGE